MSDADRCKVDTVRDRYEIDSPSAEFDSLGAYLVARWRGDRGFDATGYKQLTEWFNKQLLETVYDRQGRETLGTRLDSEYTALAGDDDELRTEVVADLASDGIDAERLAEDFVSWSTMRRHLNGCLDAEKDPVTATTDWEVESIRIATEQAASKTRDALGSLGRKGRLTGGEEVDIDVQLEVSCPECTERRPLPEALELGYVCEEHHEPADEPVEVGRVSSALQSIAPIGLTPLSASVVADEFGFVSELLTNDVVSTAVLDASTLLGV
jgi:hypothetical protein